MNLLRGTLDLLILRTLSHGALHGYAASKYIRESSGQALQIEEGALYPALRRLEKKGFLTAWWDATDTGREAKFYELTDAGREHLDTELHQWERYVVAMRRVLFEADPPTPALAPSS